MPKPASTAVAAVVAGLSLAAALPAAAGFRHRLKPPADPRALAAAAPQAIDRARTSAAGVAPEHGDTTPGWDTIYSAGGAPLAPRGRSVRIGSSRAKPAARPLPVRAPPSPS
jgi:hypothetical protein